MTSAAGLAAVLSASAGDRGLPARLELAVLANAGGRALGATLALAGALLVFRVVYRRLRGRIESRYRSRVHDLEIHSFQIVRAERLWRAATGILGAAWAVFAVVLWQYSARPEAFRDLRSGGRSRRRWSCRCVFRGACSRFQT
jgi:hypothetical protein